MASDLEFQSLLWWNTSTEQAEQSLDLIELYMFQSLLWWNTSTEPAIWQDPIGLYNEVSILVVVEYFY